MRDTDTDARTCLEADEPYECLSSVPGRMAGWSHRSMSARASAVAACARVNSSRTASLSLPRQPPDRYDPWPWSIAFNMHCISTRDAQRQAAGQGAYEMQPALAMSRGHVVPTVLSFQLLPELARMFGVLFLQRFALQRSRLGRTKTAAMRCPQSILEHKQRSNITSVASRLKKR